MTYTYLLGHTLEEAHSVAEPLGRETDTVTSIETSRCGGTTQADAILLQWKEKVIKMMRMKLFLKPIRDIFLSFILFGNDIYRVNIIKSSSSTSSSSQMELLKLNYK